MKNNIKHNGNISVWEFIRSVWRDERTSLIFLFSLRAEISTSKHLMKPRKIFPKHLGRRNFKMAIKIDWWKHSYCCLKLSQHISTDNETFLMISSSNDQWQRHASSCSVKTICCARAGITPRACNTDRQTLDKSTDWFNRGDCIEKAARNIHIQTRIHTPYNNYRCRRM